MKEQEPKMPLGIKSMTINNGLGPNDAIWTKIRNPQEDVQWLVSGILVKNIDDELALLSTEYLIRLKEEIRRIKDVFSFFTSGVSYSPEMNGLITFIMGCKKLDEALTKETNKRK